MPSVFLVKIIAAIFDFYRGRRLGRERNLYQGGRGGGGQTSKERTGEGVGLAPLVMSK